MSFTAKSLVGDVYSNWGAATYAQLRQIDLWFEGSKLLLTPSDYTAYGSFYASSTETYNAMDTDRPKTGAVTNNGWVHTGTASFRFSFVFNSPQTFDKIIINNGHHSGTVTTRGFKDVILQSSTDAITSTTFEEAVTNSTSVFDGEFPEHAATDTVQDYELTLVGAGLTGDISITLPTITCEIDTESNDVDITLPSIDAEMFVDAFSFSGNLEGDIGSLSMTGTTLEYTTMTATLTAFSAMTVDMEAIANYVRAACRIPMFTMDAKTGIELVSAIPKLTCSIQATNEILARLASTLPSLQFIGYLAPSLEADLPSLDMTSEATNQVLTTLATQFPEFICAMEATYKTATTLTCTIPRMRMSNSVYYSASAILSCSLPSIRAKIGLIGGLKADIVANIPPFKSKIDIAIAQSVELDTLLTSFGVSMTTPLVEDVLTTLEDTDEILRYKRGELR